MKRRPDMMLPVTVYDLPIDMAFQPDGVLRDHLQHYSKIGVCRIVAGPVAFNVTIDVKRPYYKPLANEVTQ